ncbi:MAG: hypothetical protein ACI4N4_05690 [Candidatus Fimenecus sp.]
MSRSKKIVGLVLAVVLVLGSFTMAFAAPTDPGAGNYAATVTVTPADTNIEAGASTTVSVKVNTNFTVGALSVPLFYEKANVTISNVTVPDTGYFTAETSESASNAAKIFASAGLDSATYGYVMVTYLPAAKASTRVFADEQVLSFTVTALPGAADGTAVEFKTVDASRKTSTNPTGTLYVGFINSDTINAVPTNIEATGLVTSSTVTIGSAVLPADLALTEAGSTAGIIIDTHKTFGGQYAGVVYGFTQAAAATFKRNTYITTNVQATNGGSLAIKSSTGQTTATGNYGTGSTIEVLNSDGSSTGKVYVVCIFGDVNGDGSIAVGDATIIKNAVSDTSVLPANSVQRMAANVQIVNNATVMHNIAIAEATAVKNYVSGTKFTPALIAAKHNQYNTFYQ